MLDRLPMPRRIGPIAGATPTDAESAVSQPRQLPPDLLRAASQRLAIIALMAVVLWLTGTAAYHLAIRAMTGGDPRWQQWE